MLKMFALVICVSWSAEVADGEFGQKGLRPREPGGATAIQQLWAEDMDNYLRRRMQKLEERIQALEAKADIQNGFYRSNRTADNTD